MTAAVLVLLALAPAAPVREDPARAALRTLQGLWVIDRWTVEGEPVEPEPTGASVTIRGDTLTVRTGDHREAVTIGVDPTTTPARIDLWEAGFGKGDPAPGVWVLKGDVLTICAGRKPDDGGPPVRPARVDQTAGATTIVLRRAGPAETEAEALQGEWEVTGAVKDGAEVPDLKKPGLTLYFSDDRVSLAYIAGRVPSGRFALDPKADPATITITSWEFPGFAGKGVYRRDADRLTVCVAPPDAGRPAGFDAPAGSGRLRLVAERKKEKPKP